MNPTIKKITQFLALHSDAFINDPAYQMATLRHAPEMSEIIWKVKRALKKGIVPIKSDHGSSTYFLFDEDEKPIAIFKLDFYTREYAAYRLDHHAFARVPPTVITTLSHSVFGGEVTGSCQLYIEEGIAGVEIEPKHYDELSPESIRRIAQFDIRLINEDRHTSNILICNRSEAIPIDHGFTLSKDLGRMKCAWMSWKQTALPFSSEEQCYISWLDPEKDRAILIEEMGFPEKIANRLYVSTLLLKLSTIHEFYPHHIGEILSNSQFEILIQRLIQRNAPSWKTFTQYVNEEIEVTLEEYEINQRTHFSTIS